jgi:hypothetical protein
MTAADRQLQAATVYFRRGNRRDPASVRTHELFAAGRAAYEAARVPGPRRAWTPVGSLQGMA